MRFLKAKSKANFYADRRKVVEALMNYFTNNGGEIQLKTRAVKLLTDDATGRVIGIKVLKNNETYANIKAKGVVLANGSFQNNKEMRVRYLGRYADQAVLRAVPYNRGDSLIMAQEVGALLSRSFATTYGHVNPYPPLTPETEEEYEKADKDWLRNLFGACQAFSTTSIIVNIDGKRFVDESLHDEITSMEILQQDEGRAFILLDSAIAKNVMKSIELIEQSGGVVEKADTIEQLVEKVASYGFNAENLTKTINEFNKAVDEGTVKNLAIPKTKLANKLATAPFYAVQCTGGVSGPYGGIMINSRGQALRSGLVPLPGLYVAPHAAGGIYFKNYVGSLALCAVFGRIAGLSVAEDVAKA